MSILATYNPLKTVWIPGAEIADPQGIVVVVGPNSSGKTLFLRDIEGFLLTGQQGFVVCESIAPQRPSDYQGFVDELIAKNYLQQVPGQDSHYRTYLPFLTSKGPKETHQRSPFTLSALEKAYNEFHGERGGNNPGWFIPIGIALVAPLSLDQRRRVCNQGKSFDYKAQAPEHPIQGLYLRSAAQERLAEETGNVFGNAVWLDISEHGVLQLRISDSRQRPSHGEMSNPLEARKYAIIEDEGDGYRSYVGICLSLLLATQPVALIDEPELCLHPPQAYHIGRFIGNHATDEHVTFVATHSSHVLRGILETGRKVTVIRLTRRNKKFTGRLIAEQELVDAVRHPRTRAEAVLDGIFSKGVVLVESEGDREEYQAAAEAIEDYPAREIHFVPVGGTGGFAEPLRFYRSLDIPAAVIADLDALCDANNIAAISKALVRSPTDVRDSIDKLQSLVQQIRSLPPPITEDDAQARLKRLSDKSLNWKQGDDNVLRRELNELEEALRRIQKLKEGGIDAYVDHSEIHALLKEVVAQFVQIGLFFVPVGELEDWVISLMFDKPKSGTSKTDRAAIAADRIRAATNRTGDIWEFVQGVFDHLQERSE
jgi:ABC-type cobalamin/Fe3+-siderophores transport system ATPase subunit